jgi:hypothetical protein
MYLGPAITFALIDFIVALALAVEIGHRAGAKGTSIVAGTGPEPLPDGWHIVPVLPTGAGLAGQDRSSVRSGACASERRERSERS